MSAIVFLDLETTGLRPDDHIWEFGAVRRDEHGESTYHAFVQHDENKALDLPESFRTDHDERYNADEALSIPELIGLLKVVFAGKPRVVGACPNFDTDHLALVLGYYGIEPLWHYHLWDAEVLALGWLHGRAAAGHNDAIRAVRNGNLNDSDALSRFCGIEPPTTTRHQALGDVRWAMALYDKVTGQRNKPEPDHG